MGLHNMDQLARIASHSFDNWSADLMQLPPNLDEWQYENVVRRDQRAYREMYSGIQIKDCQEKIFDCAECGIVSRDFHLNKIIEGESDLSEALQCGLLRPTVRLRRGILDKLKIVDSTLRSHGLFLFVMSGWRHPRHQEIVLRWASRRFGKESATSRLAPPDITPHSTGAAVDIELWSLQSNVSLTKLDIGDEIGFYSVERDSGYPTEREPKRQIRRLLFHSLCTPGVCLPEDCFTIHPGETWHFGFGDPLTAMLTRQGVAIYGPVDLIRRDSLVGTESGAE